jgi:hypothetical protein
MQTRTRAILLAITTAAALSAGLFAPAAAERVAFADPADMGGASLNDIRRVTVNHGVDRLAVRIRFVDLRSDSEGGPASLTMLFNTRAARSGPEFRLTTGLYEGTDYQLRRVRNGRPVGEPLTCPHQLRLDQARDVLRFHVDRSCLDLPTRVRIGVKMTDEYDASHPVTDWLGEPRSFTRAVSTS